MPRWFLAVLLGTTALTEPAMAQIITPPPLPQPTAVGDVVAQRFQNFTVNPMVAGYQTWGIIFKQGDVPNATVLIGRACTNVACTTGTNTYMQFNCKATHTDNSCRHAILTMIVPQIAAGATQDIMINKCTSSCPPAPSPAAPSAATVAAETAAATVAFTGGFTGSANCNTILGVSNGGLGPVFPQSTQTWLSGPAVNEYWAIGTVDGGLLKVECDIRAYADGTRHVDVIFLNDWFQSQATKGTVNYNATISFNGVQQVIFNSISQYIYSDWHFEVNGPGLSVPNPQYDMPYMQKTGAYHNFDITVGADFNTILNAPSGFNSLTAANTAPIQPGSISQNEPATGASDNIGQQPAWTSLWLNGQDWHSWKVVLANGDASGSIPYHVADENTNKPVLRTNFPTATWSPANTLFLNPTTNWQLSEAHWPDPVYTPYLITGSHYRLQLLQQDALRCQNSSNPGFQDRAIFVYFSGNADSLYQSDQEQRAVGWCLRQVAEAAYITPDNDSIKSYLTTALAGDVQSMATQFVLRDAGGIFGRSGNWVEGQPGFGANEISLSPWQQGFIQMTLGRILNMNFGGATATNTLAVMNWLKTHVSGYYTNIAEGFSPLDGAAYWMFPCTTIACFDSSGDITWGIYYTANLNPAISVGLAPPVAQGGVLKNVCGPGQSYANDARAAASDAFTNTQDPQSLMAVGFLVAQQIYAYNKVASCNGGIGFTQDYANQPLQTTMPKLPDGFYLPYSQWLVDVTGNAVITLTANSQDSLLAVVGPGTATLNGGSNAVDILVADASLGGGPTTMNAGTGNDYLFGGAGNATFRDGTGNNYMNGGQGTNVFDFSNINGSGNGNSNGQDTISNFNISTDTLKIKSNANGNGLTTAAAIVSSATQSGDDTIINLGSGNTITLKHIRDKTQITSTITVVP